MWRSFLYVVATVATEDAASLLQTRKNSAHSQLMYNVDKTVEIVNRTHTQCSCAFNGCGLFACPACPLIQCACSCSLEKEECSECCKGNKKCMQAKLKKLAKKRMADLASSLKYRTEYDQYKRITEMDHRAREDWEWRHEKKMRSHIMDKRKYNDGKHRIRMKSHATEKKRQKQLRKSLNKWVLENVEEAIRLSEGGKDVTPPNIIMPNCDCPKQWCPPTKGCPPCPKPKCPPCRECKGVINECRECKEDGAIKKAIHHFLQGNKMDVCPPQEEYDDYCEYKDTWPIDICPVDKECD